jgi:aminoglycoside 6-adenylyltransferase
MPYIAKGILRDELPYAKYMFDVVLMGCIRKLLCWHIGSEHNWSVNPGYCEKWFKRYLPADLYNEFVALFPTTDYTEMLESLSKSGDFIRKIGILLADSLSYPYPTQEDAQVTAFISCSDRACPSP